LNISFKIILMLLLKKFKNEILKINILSNFFTVLIIIMIIIIFVSYNINNFLFVFAKIYFLKILVSEINYYLIFIT